MTHSEHSHPDRRALDRRIPSLAVGPAVLQLSPTLVGLGVPDPCVACPTGRTMQYRFQHEQISRSLIITEAQAARSGIKHFAELSRDRTSAGCASQLAFRAAWSLDRMGVCPGLYFGRIARWMPLRFNMDRLRIGPRESLAYSRERSSMRAWQSPLVSVVLGLFEQAASAVMYPQRIRDEE